MTGSIRDRVVHDERGMTIIELLVGVVAATLVIFFGFMSWDLANRSQVSTTDRIDAVGRGRIAMERITREIRSQQCGAGNSAAMIWASDTGMQFYASVTDEDAVKNSAQPVEMRRVEWIKEPQPFKDGAVVGDIVETVWANAAPAGVAPSFPKVTRKGTIADDVEIDPNTALFRYYGYAPGAVGRPSSTPFPMTTMTPTTTNPTGRGVAEANLQAIVLVDINYLSRPRRAKVAKGAAVLFANRVSVRTADPSNPGASPLCL